MNRHSLLVASVLCAALAGCAGEDPELLELQAWLQTRGAPSPDATTRDRLNATFARQAVRAAAYGDATLDGERWSPVVQGEAAALRAADVSTWLRSGAIDALGTFRPSDACGQASSALETVPPSHASLPQLDRRVAALECALAELAGRRIEVQWTEGAEHAIAFDDQHDSAKVNARLLALLEVRMASALPVVEKPVAQDAKPLALAEDRAPAPHELEAARRADGLGVLVGAILEPLFWLLLLPARLFIFCCTCEWPDFTQAGRAAPLPILQNLLTILPAAFAWALGRRKGR